MAQYASIKRRPKAEAKPSPGTLAHNQRLANNIDLLPEENRLPNHHLNKLSNVTKVFNNWKALNEERYQDINNRKLRSDAHRLESLAIILSEEQVGKCKPGDIWENAHKFKEWFETRYKTTVRTMDWHRDEGHIDDEGNVVRNEHIHLEFDNVNDDGKMVRKLFSKGDLVGFQDKIAEIYKPLGFIRGEDTAKKNRGDKPKLGIPQREWKKTKTIEAKAKKEPLAKLKDIQAINEQLRAELKTLKAKRENYAKLEAEIELLKEQAKAKELTIEELHKVEEKLKADNKTLQRLAYTSEEHWIGEENNLTEFVEVSYFELYERATSNSVRERGEYLENKVDEYRSKSARLEEKLRLKDFETTWHNTELEEQKKENTSLKSQNEQLEAKIASLPSPDVTKELETLKNDFKQLDSEYWELDNLAYDENHIVQEEDADGILPERKISYKELHSQSKQKIETLEKEVEEKEEINKMFDNGYSKIEENIFGKNENRSVNEIVERIYAVTTILSNISKYLKIGKDKIISLFGDHVPEKTEIEREQINKIASTLSSDKEKSSSPSVKRM